MDEIVKVSNGNLALVEDAVEKYFILKVNNDVFEEYKKQFNEAVKNAMFENDIKKFENEKMFITYKNGGYRMAWDEDKIAKFFEVFSKYDIKRLLNDLANFGFDLKDYEYEYPLDIKALKKQTEFNSSILVKLK